MASRMCWRWRQQLPESANPAQSLIRAGLPEEIPTHRLPVLAGHAFPLFEDQSSEYMQRETTEGIDIQEATHRSVRVVY